MKKVTNPPSRWVALAACVCFVSLYPISFTTAGIFFVHLIPYYNIGNKPITWIAALQGGFAGCFGVVIGIAQKRFGPRRVGVVATVMAVTGLLIPYFEDNIYVLYVTFGAMFGIGSITFCFLGFTVPYKLFSNHCPLLSGVLATFITIGGVIWAPIIERLIAHFGWKGTLLVMAGLHLHGLVLSMLVFDPSDAYLNSTKKSNLLPPDSSGEIQLEKINTANGKNKTKRQKLFVKLFKKFMGNDNPDREFSESNKSWLSWKVNGAIYTIASTLLIVCHMNFYTYIPLLNEQLGFSTQEGALLMSVINICSACVRLLAGCIANLKCVSCSFLYGLSTTATAAISMCSLLCTSYPALNVLSALYGIASGINMSLQGPSLIENVPQRHMEFFLGLRMSIQGLAIFLLHVSAGVILDVLGDSNNLFFIYGSCALVGGLLVLGLVTAHFCYTRYTSKSVTLQVDM